MAEEYVVHEQEDTLGEGESEPRILARNVEIADSTLSQMRGLMFRSELPEALVMEVGGGFSLTGGPPRQFVHMLFVRHPLDVIWLADDDVQKVARMRPWRSVGMAKADRIIELPAGAAEGVEVGDTVRVVDETDVNE
ncbi:DUF192 domain-containing protein [Halovenus sp. WSH3]|uniref:DUF192 domain-containing protein n=1 Tax=Halovenus carboxidivorans TaxID=2692199 RepID=A0A6B0T3C5_9EURY|nr:DUF192 domain-containing protein [Halovenus carboxidivorans]MXR50686.1 DUF192 domain-containing protein [Halovenus carboxidivorans]